MKGVSMDLLWSVMVAFLSLSLAPVLVKAWTTVDRSDGLDPATMEDEGHIREHYDGKADLDTERMAAQERQFHFFTLHDYDNDTMLDGLELLKALQHMNIYAHKRRATDSGFFQPPYVTSDESNFYIQVVDDFFLHHDMDGDGYVNYAEYRRATVTGRAAGYRGVEGAQVHHTAL